MQLTFLALKRKDPISPLFENITSAEQHGEKGLASSEAESEYNSGSNARAPLILSCVCMSDSPIHEGHESRQARRYHVSGKVQGVGYRYFASRVARQLGVTGYAKNLRDGTVEVYAVGTAAMLAALRKELQRGPRSAVVSNVTEEDAALEPKFESGFSIERDHFDV